MSFIFISGNKLFFREIDIFFAFLLFLADAMNSGMHPAIASPPPITRTGSTSKDTFPGAAMAMAPAPSPKRINAPVF